jgi:hypothetical protein
MAALRHTPHVPPSFAQRLHDEQFLHALQGFAPVQVAAWSADGPKAMPIAARARPMNAKRLVTVSLLEGARRKRSRSISQP